jgi:hypothetical protein
MFFNWLFELRLPGFGQPLLFTFSGINFTRILKILKDSTKQFLWFYS